MRWASKLVGRLVDRVGGRPRLLVVAALASVLGLDGADKGAIGAMAGPLQNALGLSRTDTGLLLTTSLAFGALTTLAFGWLVDRVNRTRLLAWMIVIWGVSTLLSATATSLVYLLVSRLLLAGVAGGATPAVASLMGDYFPEGERGTIYGYVLAGELAGTGVGFLLAGELASWSWRAGFVALTVPAFLVAWWMHRLPEPARGGSSRLSRGRTHFGARETGEEDRPELREVQALARRARVKPREQLLFDETPRNRSLWWAVLYVARIPSNALLIVASALGYFFFSSLRTFGVQYLHLWFGVSHAWATALLAVMGVGGVFGVLISGRFADTQIRRGRLASRVVVAEVAFLLACALLVPSLLVTVLWVGILLLTASAFALGATNPPIDAARLDIMHPDLWGRAESVRTVLRKAGEAIAPLTVGFIADHFFGGSAEEASSLHFALLVMLIPLSVGALIALAGIRTYPRDVATAAENQRRTATDAHRPPS